MYLLLKLYYCIVHVSTNCEGRVQYYIIIFEGPFGFFWLILVTTALLGCMCASRTCVLCTVCMNCLSVTWHHPDITDVRVSSPYLYCSVSGSLVASNSFAIFAPLPPAYSNSLMVGTVRSTIISYMYYRVHSNVLYSTSQVTWLTVQKSYRSTIVTDMYDLWFMITK